ncbi:DUF4920 domain-containing protein [candidate division KSB1 bacterium]|nr:DUF4920 domain-containing protein [candidate division KSB1 bacterium]
MRSKMFLAMLLMFVVACTQKTSEAEKYGAALSLNEQTKVSAILAAPESYLGKKVLIAGQVLDVCAKAGCWMEIASDQSEQKIKVKVNDGEIVFPMAAKGKTAKVEGEVYKIELTAEQALGYQKHVAEEQGVPFDSTSVTGAMTIYQIKGLGAEIGE